MAKESVTSSILGVLSLRVPSIVRASERPSFTCARDAVAVRLTFDKNSSYRCSKIMDNP